MNIILGYNRNYPGSSCRPDSDILEKFGSLTNDKLYNLFRQVLDPIGDVRMTLYQRGLYTFVFHLSEENKQDIIMQLATHPASTDLGQVVENDFKNLQRLYEIDPTCVPRPLLVDLVDFEKTERSIIFTQFFEGYHELHREESAKPHFYTITEEKNRRTWNANKSQIIVNKMIGILANYFFKTYNSTQNSGLLISDVTINAGDFLIGPNNDLKLITARSLSAADPIEFLYYLFSINQAEYDLSVGTLFSGFYVKKEERFSHICNEIKAQMSPFFDRPDETFKGWIKDFEATVRQKNQENNRLIQQQRYSEISNGYRRTIEMIGAGYNFMDDLEPDVRINNFRTNLNAQEEHAEYLNEIINGVKSLVI